MAIPEDSILEEVEDSMHSSGTGAGKFNFWALKPDDLLAGQFAEWEDGSDESRERFPSPSPSLTALPCLCKDMHRWCHPGCDQTWHGEDENQKRTSTGISLKQLRDTARLGCEICSVLFESFSADLSRCDPEGDFAGL
jgi:hypothetical protein